ncbi:MAG: BamA/TamA family outer membrane protein [Verrucomicrobia bacterium]|nr:BamA/TamA family outer membrane protein [Verrucomicrobiota bacterium]
MKAESTVPSPVFAQAITFGILFCCLIGGVFGVQSVAARISVSGTGWVESLAIRNLANQLHRESDEEEHYSVTFIENLLLIVRSRQVADGYLDVRIHVDLVAEDGTESGLLWTGEGLLDIPSDTSFSAVRLRLESGVQYFFEELQITGLTVLPIQEARRFFYNDAFLLGGRTARAYSPGVLRAAVNNLEDELRFLGFQDAAVRIADVRADPARGAVLVAIDVQQGLLHKVRSIEVVTTEPGLADDWLREERSLLPVPFSRFWLQETQRLLLNEFWAAGFADATVRADVRTERDNAAGIVWHDVRCIVTSREQIRISDVRISGLQHTLERLVRRTAVVSEGDLLNPIALDEARSRLGETGYFSRSERADFAARRSCVACGGVSFVERPRHDFKLYTGYGSYEYLRAGLELRQRNLWGRGHSASTLLMQSFKSSRAEVNYSFPRFLDADQDAFLNARLLRREEPTFLRTEYGLQVGVDRRLSRRSRVGVSYRLENLRSSDFDGFAGDVGVVEARVGSILAYFSRETRDNPIFPRRGSSFRVEMEFSAPLFLADVTFQRIQASYSRSWEFNEATLLHGNLSYGIVGSWRETVDNIPINKRFFPGGENSIRSYRYAGATPRAADGTVLGAEVFSLMQWDLEYFLSPMLSVVAFTDQVLISDDYQTVVGDEWLSAVGFGVRYRTLLGPLRLEAGFNLRRRAFDPSYVVLLSLGYPF